MDSAVLGKKVRRTLRFRSRRFVGNADKGIQFMFMDSVRLRHRLESPCRLFSLSLRERVGVRENGAPGSGRP